ncbi:MAG: hypothetical protein ACXWBS_05410 [Chthoniobacterales bacterium]
MFFFAATTSLQASFHLMQIEQVIGGVNGDTSAQAIQLRMRFASENLISGAELIVVDSAGNNPVSLITFPSDVVSGAGRRILIASTNFAKYEGTAINADFTMTNLIPPSYIPAGRLIYRRGTTIYWSVSWGGANYTGPNTGTLDNDNDGNFGPPFAGTLPASSTRALLFSGTASAGSTTNAADYSLTSGAATFTNNAGNSTLLVTPGSLGNIATRLQVGTGDNVLIAGFIVDQPLAKKVLIRSRGPSLSAFGIANPLANPQLELHDETITIANNNDWGSTISGGIITADQSVDIANSGLKPDSTLEPAIIATLASGSYTAIVKDENGGTGVGTIEVYQLDSIGHLANISTRGFVQTGDNVMIGGFIIVDQPLRIFIRAKGPSLGAFGIPNPLANPQIELHDANNIIATNDDWQTTQIGGVIMADQSSQIQSNILKPGNALESAMIVTLQPGNYTVIVRGVSSGTGVGTVEVYSLQ